MTFLFQFKFPLIMCHLNLFFSEMSVFGSLPIFYEGVNIFLIDSRIFSNLNIHVFIIKYLGNTGKTQRREKTIHNRMTER